MSCSYSWCQNPAISGGLCECHKEIQALHRGQSLFNGLALEAKELRERLSRTKEQCIAEGRIVKKCNVRIKKLEAVLREMIDMVPQEYEYRKNSAARAHVVLDWTDIGQCCDNQKLEWMPSGARCVNCLTQVIGSTAEAPCYLGETICEECVPECDHYED